MNISLATDIKRSDLINRLVLDYNTTEEVGRVKQLWLDVKTHQVVGLTCTSGLLGYTKTFLTWEQIKTIGTDSILVTIPEETELEKPEGIVDSVAGLEVWTDSGNKTGKLTDYCVEIETGAVVDYLFVSKDSQSLSDGMYRLPASAVISVGKKRIIVSDAMVQNPQQYGESPSEKIPQAPNLLQEDYTQTQEDLTSAMQGTPEFASQLQEKTHQVTARAQEKLSEFSNQVQGKFSALKKELQDDDDSAVKSNSQESL